ncbi:unnamed protein product [Adineta steineri]|uniref:Uncharacterized protein n=1 Tax=Adineta steineri TaxID=433720 RepID=A0A820A575_9BILA|nr:unnamed protein product [Adineta steineri]CAF4179692.1 unnamed protein product [Adineta steineri]
MNRLVIKRFVGVMIELLVDCYPVLAYYMYTMSSRTFRMVILKLCRLALQCRLFHNTNQIQPTLNTIPLQHVAAHTD